MLTTLLLYGIGTWAVPLVVSFGFVDEKGKFRIDEIFFKSIMIVVGGCSGAWLMTRYFAGLRADTAAAAAQSSWTAEGVRVGGAWMAINLALDYALWRAGIFKKYKTFGHYFKEIGLRYSLMVATGWTVGSVHDALLHK